jgi:hypothetical protein
MNTAHVRLFTIFLPCICLIVWQFLYTYIVPRKPWWHGFRPHLLRRHLESFGAWEKRWLEAYAHCNETEHAVLNDPSAVRRQVSQYGFVSSLPANHPLCLRALRAKYPDGPSYEELANISVLVIDSKPALQILRGGKK